jgi:N-acylneuraminate cytidylyltransferase
LKDTSTLFVIPARGGSKGIPGKNIKILGDKPLILYSVDFARQFAEDDNICVSSDDDTILKVVNDYGLATPFKRPAELATDTAGTYEVLVHALEHYERKGKKFDKLILLQPTSPFRNPEHYIKANELYNDDLDMVVTVSESKANPYFNLFEEDETGMLKKSKPGNYTRRQDCPKVYAYNGSIYIINAQSLQEQKLHEFKKVKKSIMPSEYSVDLDTEDDWMIAEYLLKRKHGF